MPNQFYSPNAKLTGGALFASFNSKDGNVYLKLLKQIANNPDKKGNFDGKNPLNIKLGQDEIADKDNFPAKSGFGLSVNKTQGEVKTEVKVGFTLASAERFSLYLQNALVHIFDAEYSQDLKDAKEYADKKKVETKSEVNQESTPQEPEF